MDIRKSFLLYKFSFSIKNILRLCKELDQTNIPVQVKSESIHSGNDCYCLEAAELPQT